ncbi:hypothetical protein D0869_08916 [Hortaea werneckii]|uniref:Major facilitator superfamily (MFS) profile domain-containing protein n=1 Tax=Hortaea werneckii TaxID=91943 RepID=A0A3M6YJ71_HORWE|nr:hypothetical protein D0869_08916 [Hortaea werneckii]RMY03078.1 hypothetical protein D0868_07642 [Hortaea werneckii]RMY30946.1 hypothetical protein D0866_07640 [Hortaea werneckii]
MGPDHHFDAPIGEESEWSAKIAAWSPEERRQQEKKLVRKIDVRLLPILFIMYILNYVDRNALPQARVQGLEDDIGLQGVQYNVVLSLTFIGYILWQVPSNMLLSKVGRPRYYIACWMIAWGLVSGCSGAVQNFAGMAACRFFLGITEFVCFCQAGLSTMLTYPEHLFLLVWLSSFPVSIVLFMHCSSTPPLITLFRLVYQKGTRLATGFLLLRRHAVWRLRWALCCRYCSSLRESQNRKLEVGFHQINVQWTPQANPKPLPDGCSSPREPRLWSLVPLLPS